MPYVQVKLNRFRRAVQEQQRETALLQAVQVKVVSVQAEIQ
jgi:hypothetical protein